MLNGVDDNNFAFFWQLIELGELVLSGLTGINILWTDNKLTDDATLKFF